MKQNIFEVLTIREREVFLLRNRDKISVKKTAEYMGCSVNTIKKYSKRIKDKINALEKYDIDVICVEQNEIEEIFNEDATRMASKKTVAQVQFLAQCSQMSCKGKKSVDTTTERVMRCRTGIGKKITKREASLEERKRMRENTANIPRPDRLITKAYMQYYSNFETATDINEMASLEIVLRAAGLIFRTPYINKLNRRTSMQMRAQECGFVTVMVKPGYGETVPQGSKYVESIKDDMGHTEYSTWLFPKQFVCQKTKQKRIII